MTTNFAFLPPEFRTNGESATRAEGHIMGDPRAACFHARFALESAVHWLYHHSNRPVRRYDALQAAIVESVEQQKTRMRGHLAELDALFACLQSRAFNGEL